MRIGILTFHSSINNGAVVQCYSLSKKLATEFPNSVVEIIDYRMPRIEAFYDVSLKNLIAADSFLIRVKKMVSLCLNPGVLRQQRARAKAFKEAESVLPLSKITILDDKSEQLFTYINKNYDIIIAGSDAIWNYSLRGFPNPYFLSTEIQIPMFSYAASCYGMEYEVIPDEERRQIKEILNQYTFLGVRDDESERFARLMGVEGDIYHTCDPTVFLDVEDLPINEKAFLLRLNQKKFDFERKSIGVMGSDKMIKMVKKMYGKDYQIVSLYNYSVDADVNLHDISPYEWAYVFRLFSLTFTTYFHGTLLSLRNGTPVICIALETVYSKKHKTKVQDFLERIGFEANYFHTDYLSENFEAIQKKADEMLAGDYSQVIKTRMDSEAKNVEIFLQKIHNVIKGE